MDGSKIGFGLDGIGRQLQDRLLTVPLYQRSSSWGEDQIGDFSRPLAITERERHDVAEPKAVDLPVRPCRASALGTAAGYRMVVAPI